MGIDADLAILNKEYKTATGLDWRTAYIGDGDGVIYDPEKDGNVFVRYPASDDNFTAPVSVRLRANVPIDGNDSQIPVKVGMDKDGVLAVMDIDFEALKAHGTSPLDANAADKRRGAFTAPENYLPLYSYAVSAPGAPSTEIATEPLVYIADGTVHFFTGSVDDLAASIPAAGLHRLACTFLKTDDTMETVNSTAKADVEPLGEADIQECVDGASAGAKPAWAWRLANGQTSITNDDRWMDLRQRINASNSVNNLIPPVLIDGISDAVQLTVQGHTTQTSDLFVLEQSDGTNVLDVDNDGNTDIQGHFATGASGTIATYVIADIAETFTDPAGNVTGLWIRPIIDADSGVIAIQSRGFRVDHEVTGGQNITGVTYAFNIISRYSGTATVSNLYGGFFRLENTSTGTITTGYGQLISTPTNSGGGSFGTVTALYISNQNIATTNFAIRTFAGNIVFNESGDADTDFRVEGDSKTALLCTDASADRVGIGIANPSYLFHIYSVEADFAVSAGVRTTWEPSSSAGNQYPAALYVTATYDTTHTPAGGFMSAVRVAGEIADTGVMSYYGHDLLFTNSAAGTVPAAIDIYIRSAVNSGGGTLTNYYGVYVDAQTAATNNYALYTNAGKCRFGDEVNIVGDLNHDGSNVGFYGTAPVAQSSGWTITNLNSDKVLDCDSTTLDELADVVGTIVTELIANGLFAT